MNILRTLLFSIMLYASSFIVYAVGASVVGSAEEPTVKQYVFYWVLTIPITLLLAKWYFKTEQSTLRRGIILGVVAVVVAFFFDGVSIAATAAAGKSIDVFKQMYGDWKFYVTVLEIILLCAYAGFEFDKTYTK